MNNKGISRKQLFVHVPYGYFRVNHALLVKKGLQPEIYFSYRDLKNLDRNVAESLNTVLEKNGLNCNFHAPFMDLNPGAVDQDVRLVTLSKYRAVLEAASIFSPMTVVFHPGYDRWRYDGQVNKWLKESLKTWRDVLKLIDKYSHDTKIVVENIFEHNPSSLEELFNRLEDPRFGFCFDTGHFYLFSDTDIEHWMEHLGHRLMEVHIHDNDGSRDDHLPPGKGGFPFDRFFNYLESNERKDIYLTIEAHNEEDLDLSMKYIGDRFILKP